MSEETKQSNYPAPWEDPEVVAYKLVRKLERDGKKTVVFGRAMRLGLKGEELGVDANAINAGIDSGTFTSFILPSGTEIVKQGLSGTKASGRTA